MSLRRSSAWIFVAFVALGGCANANPAVSLEGAVAPDMMCLVQPTNPRIYHGSYDANRGGAYGEAMIIRNRMVTRMRAPGPPTAEQSDFTLQGAIISLTDVDGNPIGLTSNASKFRVAATGFVSAGTDTLPTDAVGLIPIIPGSLATDMVTFVNAPPNNGQPAEIVAHIQAYGESSGGNHIDLDDFIFPVTVCNGCLCNVTPPMVTCHPGSDAEGYLPAGAITCP